VRLYKSDQGRINKSKLPELYSFYFAIAFYFQKWNIEVIDKAKTRRIIVRIIARSPIASPTKFQFQHNQSKISCRLFYSLLDEALIAAEFDVTQELFISERLILIKPWCKN